MFPPFRLKPKNNPILNRIAQPALGPTPHQFLTVTIGITVGMMAGLLLLYPLGVLTEVLTILQMAAFPTVFILTLAIVLATSTITLGEIRGEAFDLLRLTPIASGQMAWGLSGGIFYRLRKTIVAFVWAFGVGLMPIVLRVRDVVTGDPPLSQMPLLMFLLFFAASGIAFMLVSSAVLTTLRFRRVAFAGAITLLSNGALLIGGLMLWLIVIGLAGGVVSMILALMAVPLPYAIGLIFARRWRTDPLRLIAVTAHAPVAVIVFVLFTAILGFGLGEADQSDTILFWAVNGVFGFFLILSIQSEWGQASCPELIALLAWQGLLVAVLAMGEAVGSAVGSAVGFQTAVWLVADALLITPFAVGIGNIDRARRWVWGDS